ncbi:hypothetical protein EON64_06250 [archaeon]|nr:MAG: hypothetical protein EON64_06250 [archaeon]
MPGFITGRLIERYGSLMVAFVGGFLFAASSVLLAIGDSLWNFLVGMMVLGVGWNLAFSAGTVMLTSCYEPHEATEVSRCLHMIHSIFTHGYYVNPLLV